MFLDIPATEFRHPLNAKRVLWGRQLEPGETICSGDCYPDQSGFWVSALYHRNRIGSLPKAHEVGKWVRPLL